MIETLLFVYLYGMLVTFFICCLINAWQNTESIEQLMMGLCLTFPYCVAWPLLSLWLCSSIIKEAIRRYNK